MSGGAILATMPITALASRVRAVTVYRSGALVTREALLDGEASELRIEGLPLALDDASLRVAIEPLAGAGGVPIAADVRLGITVPPADPSLPPPTLDEVDAVALALAQANLALEQTRAAMQRLATLEPGTRGRPEEGRAPQTSPIAARLELLAFRRTRLEQLRVREAELVEQLRALRERLATLEERARVGSQARNVRTFEIRKAAFIRLEAPRGGERADKLCIRLSYFVPGARWAPAYTVRLDRSLTRGTLELRAMVGQCSGEDWTNVALTLSTASPQQWTELPELRAQKIGRAQPEPAKTGWRAPPIGAGELYADYDRELAQGRPRAREEPKPRPLPAEPSKPTTQVMQGAAFEEVAKKEMARNMPVPMAMPVASAAMPDYAAAPKGRGSVVGAIVGGAIGGIASLFEGGGGGDGRAMLDDVLAADGASPFEPELVAGRELLDYGRLRVFAADDAQRGSLRRIDRRRAYQQLADAGLDLDLALRALDQALAAAIEFERRAAPTRHRLVAGEPGFDYVYVADAAIDLPSDGHFHALAIRADAIESKPRYVSVPRESQDVFRIVALLNPCAAPLLAGPADVYVDGRFALTSDLETTPIGGRIELGLGVEQAIKIARNVTFVEDGSGLLKRQLSLLHTLELEIGNNLGRSATVEVRERLSSVPDDQADDIQIGVREVSPAWDDYEQKQPALAGGKRWTIEVPANDKRTLRASWVITIPSQHELIGGNRRET